MYLYGKVTIDNQLIKFAAFVTGVSIGESSTIFYTLAPCKAFIGLNIINFLSVDCDKNNCNATVNFAVELNGSINFAKCDFFTDSLASINLLKLE